MICKEAGKEIKEVQRKSGVPSVCHVLGLSEPASLEYATCLVYLSLTQPLVLPSQCCSPYF